MLASPHLDQWLNEEAAPFEGWDFSHLRGRLLEEEPTWDYSSLARSAVQNASDILDVATGGGEVLASLAPFSGRISAVEGYAPNVEVARRRLEPLGVQVLKANTASGMPFEDGRFDLILNRHGGFRAAEMYRVLKPGGVFLSQQVAGDNLVDLTEVFDAELPYPHNTLARRCEEFEALGGVIRRAEAWRGGVTFADVGAVVYFLKAVPWVVRDFSVGRHLPALEALQASLDQGRVLRFTYTRFLLEVMKV